MSETVFDQILRGELPAHVVAEDADTLAFLDIHPAAIGHTLVIPKRPARDLLDANEDSVAAVSRMVQRVAVLLDSTFAPEGITVLQSNRAAAGQDVFYYHVHVIPRLRDDKVSISYRVVKGLDLADVARRIRATDT
jgi:histidine triad (HIT) family protein